MNGRQEMAQTTLQVVATMEAKQEDQELEG